MEEELVNLQPRIQSHGFRSFIKKNSGFFVFCFMGLLLITIPYGVMYHKSFVSRHSSQIIEKNKEIIRPYSDNRLFKKIVLDNKVTALLVHDPSAFTSTAAASMEVGSAFESDLPGLAHFLEHMLFLGSKKYPTESSFEKYITENSGGTNAFTNDVCTTYFFSISSKAFETALDMFANFFSDALLSEDAVDREVNAVNSEYENDLTSDGWRYQELMRRISSTSHPFHKFSIGNLKTLRDDPKLAGKSLHKELKYFYDKYYSSHLLNVVVIGPQSIDALEKMVKTSFSVVPDKSTNYELPFHLVKKGKAFDEDHIGKLVLYKPIGKAQKLSVIFPMDISHLKNHLSHSANFIASQLSRSYPGSLSSILKEKGFAISCGSYANSWFEDLTMITIQVSLTEEGFKDYERVIEYIFASIINLKSQVLDKNVYKEEALLSYMNFLYAGKPSVSANLIEFVLNIKKLPLNLLLVADEVLMDFQPAEIEEIYENMKIEKSLILLGSDTFKLPESKMRFKEKSTSYHYEIIDSFDKFININENQQINIFEQDDDVMKYMNGKFGGKLGKLRKVIDEEEDLTFHDYDIYSAAEKVYEEDLSTNKTKATETPKKDQSTTSTQKLKEKSKRMKNEKKPIKDSDSIDEIDDDSEVDNDYAEERKKPTKRKIFKKSKKSKKLVLNAPNSKNMRNSKKSKKLAKAERSESNEKKASPAPAKGKKKPEIDQKTAVDEEEDKYKRTLTQFDDIMKIPYLVEDISLDLKSVISDIDLRKFTDLGFPGFNRFIPDDLSIESNCKKGRKDEDELGIPLLMFSIGGDKQEYLETTYIQRSNFTSLINDLIAEKWDNKKQQQNHYLERECIIDELKVDNSTEQPSKFMHKDNAEGWLFTDRSSLKPYVYFVMHLEQSEALFTTSKEKLATEFLSFLLKKKLSESLSDAYKVGYNINFGISESGIQLFSSGWSSETHKVLKVLLDSLQEIKFTQKEYNQIKTSIVKNLQQKLKSGALSQTKSYLAKSLKMSYFTSQEMSDQLNEIELADVYAIKAKLFKNIFVKAFITGNVREESAKHKFESVLQSLNHYSTKSGGVSKESEIHKDIVKLSGEEGIVLRNWNSNPTDLNNGIINYYQAGINTSLERILLSIALKDISKSAYIFLRTKHQLGYIVFASKSALNSVEGMIIGVQGSAKAPHEMDILIEEFLHQYEEKLEEMDEKTIEVMRIRLLRSMYSRPYSAYSKLAYFWGSIKKGNYDFEDPGSVVSDLTLLSKKRVISFFKRVFKRDQKKFSVQVYSKVNNVKIPEEVLDSSKSYSGKPEILLKSVDEIRKREKYSEY